MRKLFALAAMCACSALAQDRYVVTGSATIGATDYTITIRQPASSGKRMEVESISIQSLGGEITAAMERDCTAVTTTTPLTIAAVNPETAPSGGPAQQAYSDSASTGCTALGPAWRIGDRALLPIPSYGTFKEGSGVTRNINVRLTGNGFTALYQIIVRISR